MGLIKLAGWLKEWNAKDINESNHAVEAAKVYGKHDKNIKTHNTIATLGGAGVGLGLGVGLSKMIGGKKDPKLLALTTIAGGLTGANIELSRQEKQVLSKLRKHDKDYSKYLKHRDQAGKYKNWIPE